MKRTRAIHFEMLEKRELFASDFGHAFGIHDLSTKDHAPPFAEIGRRDEAFERSNHFHDRSHQANAFRNRVMVPAPMENGESSTLVRQNTISFELIIEHRTFESSRRFVDPIVIFVPLYRTIPSETVVNSLDSLDANSSQRTLPRSELRLNSSVESTSLVAPIQLASITPTSVTRSTAAEATTTKAIIASEVVSTTHPTLRGDTSISTILSHRAMQHRLDIEPPRSSEMLSLDWFDISPLNDTSIAAKVSTNGAKKDGGGTALTLGFYRVDIPAKSFDSPLVVNNAWPVPDGMICLEFGMTDVPELTMMPSQRAIYQAGMNPFAILQIFVQSYSESSPRDKVVEQNTIESATDREQASHLSMSFVGIVVAASGAYFIVNGQRRRRRLSVKSHTRVTARKAQVP